MESRTLLQVPHVSNLTCPKRIRAPRSVGGVVNWWIYTGSDGLGSAVTLPFKVCCICERAGTLWISKISSSIWRPFEGA